MITSNKFNKLFDKDLSGVLRKSYEHSPIEYSDFIKPKRCRKYALGFRVTQEVVEDDLYGGKVRKKIGKKLAVRVTYSINLPHSEVSWDGEEFYVSSLRVADIKEAAQLAKAIQMIIKLSATKKTTKSRRKRAR